MRSRESKALSEARRMQKLALRDEMKYNNPDLVGLRTERVQNGALVDERSASV